MEQDSGLMFSKLQSLEEPISVNPEVVDRAWATLAFPPTLSTR